MTGNFDFNYMNVLPEDLAKNEFEIAKINDFHSSIIFYEEKIEGLSKMKEDEERRYSDYLLKLLSSVEGIKAIEYDRSIIKCENVLFVYNNGWTVFREEKV